jgi:hypothetical protein
LKKVEQSNISVSRHPHVHKKGCCSSRFLSSDFFNIVLHLYLHSQFLQPAIMPVSEIILEKILGYFIEHKDFFVKIAHQVRYIMNDTNDTRSDDNSAVIIGV